MSIFGNLAQCFVRNKRLSKATTKTRMTTIDNSTNDEDNNNDNNIGNGSLIT